ncbi:Uncharacterised protein [Mycobacterium tuberculosis]|uniref:Uncharacterized protein n=1 Tax=Mycobacterium tuberculosis TaxID=1773 RepID=A0A655ELE4_MYCTX|nr:Uncharacterised protein [Mycobacterium tuberculosis]
MPKLAKPDADPSSGSDIALSNPDMPAPVLLKPEPPPAPVLKKPDDGSVVEFPKPGAPPNPAIGTLIGPIVVSACRSSKIRSRTMAGMSTGGMPLDNARPSGRVGIRVPPGMVNPGMVSDTGRPMSIGSRGMVNPGKVTVPEGMEMGPTKYAPCVDVAPPPLEGAIRIPGKKLGLTQISEVGPDVLVTAPWE